MVRNSMLRCYLFSILIVSRQTILRGRQGILLADKGCVRVSCHFSGEPPEDVSVALFLVGMSDETEHSGSDNNRYPRFAVICGILCHIG